jgi:hypothetical protein
VTDADPVGMAVTSTREPAYPIDEMRKKEEKNVSHTASTVTYLHERRQMRSLLPAAAATGLMTAAKDAIMTGEHISIYRLPSLEAVHVRWERSAKRSTSEVAR